MRRLMMGTAALLLFMTVGKGSASAQNPGQEVQAIVPVVISAPGVPPSLFRTAVQIHNPTDVLIRGQMLYRPQGAGPGTITTSLQYTLSAGETQYIPDLLPAMGLTGAGTLDLIPAAGSFPAVFTVRVFNDAGAAGTLGFTQDPVRPDDALRTGDRASLIGPPDTNLFRFNVGVRALSQGASMNVTVRSASGVVLRTLQKTYGSDFFEQRDVASFLGGFPLGANETIGIEITAGHAIVYGATADNRTIDPSFQLARKN
jgi:hypothetical protein